MRLRDVKVGMKVLFEDEEATVESNDTCATYAVKIVTENGRRSWVKHRWLRKVPAKKSPEVGSAEWADEMGRQGKKVRRDVWNDEWWMSFCDGAWKTMDGKPVSAPIVKRGWELFEEPATARPKPAPTFKVGDVVDATWEDWEISGGTIVPSIVGDGWLTVKGTWVDGMGNQCFDLAARVENIRHHVAKEEEKAASEDAITVVQAKGTLAGNIRIAMARNYLHSVATMLEEKNAQYGDSASNPLRIFSKATSDEGLRVRIDDKLSRIARGNGQGNEDAIKDLIGYLALLATGGSK